MRDGASMVAKSVKNGAILRRQERGIVTNLAGWCQFWRGKDCLWRESIAMDRHLLLGYNTRWREILHVSPIFVGAYACERIASQLTE